MRYEYYCASCGDTFEVDLNMTDRDLPLTNNCVVCDALEIKRSVGSGHFRMGEGAKESNSYSVTRNMNDKQRDKAKRKQDQ